MSQEVTAEKQEADIRLYKRRWPFLLALMLLQFLAGWAFSCFGQISNFYVKFFRVPYNLVNWLTISSTLSPLLTTLPLVWLVYKGWLGFRKIVVAGAIGLVLGFALVALSTVCRGCFAAAFLGQVINGFSSQLLLATPPMFAVFWFPEKQVGTAISVNVLGLYVGNVLGLVIPVTSLHLSFDNSTASERYLLKDNQVLMILYTFFTVLAAAISVFLAVFITDRPPTPPTHAQQLKTDTSLAMTSSKVPSSFWAQTKSIFTNLTVLLTMGVAATVYQAPVVEFTTMSRIVQGFVTNNDAMGAYVMTVYCVGGAVGTLAVGKLVDVYKRYKILSIAGMALAVASSVGIVLSAQYKSYAWMCVNNFVFGIANQAVFVVCFEIVTQQTFPLDETLVSLWLVGALVPTAVFYGELGAVVYEAWGDVALLTAQSAVFLFALILCFFFNITNKRLDADKTIGMSAGNEDEATADTPLLNGIQR